MNIKEYYISYNLKSLLDRRLSEREHIIEVLLKCMEEIISPINPENKELGRYQVLTKKMNRLIFFLDNKSFSIAFPFTIKESETGKVLALPSSNINIDFFIISKIKALLSEGWFKEMNKMGSYVDKLTIFEEQFEEERISEKLISDIYDVAHFLLTYEIAYIRFDDDEEREDGHRHPRYHLDINYKNNATYKIGLEKALGDESFRDLLDISTDCYYISH